jgi:hypothetical protein
MTAAEAKDDVNIAIMPTAIRIAARRVSIA